jgi:SAM-dependent methyltransferase
VAARLVEDTLGQKERFIESEGDAWYRRNAQALAERGGSDLVVHELERQGMRASSVLEVGCANGWRLEILREKWNAQCAGIEPSAEAIADGQRRFPSLDLRRGTGDSLPFADASFDMVVLGFCLYLCDRRDLFKTAAEVDRVLRDDGYVVVFDFHPPTPYRNRYHHLPGVDCYKMDYSRMFTWNPAYRQLTLVKRSHDNGPVSANPDDTVSVAVLRKESALAYPDNPWR